MDFLFGFPSGEKSTEKEEENPRGDGKEEAEWELWGK